MKIHIKSKRGIYNVDKYNNKVIYLSTNHKSFVVPASEFSAFAGGFHNFNVSAQEMDKFSEIVQPEVYQRHLQTINNTLRVMEELLQSNITEKQECISLYEEDVDNKSVVYTREDIDRYLKEIDSMKSKYRNIAFKVYSDKKDYSDVINTLGIKFIIQKSRHTDEYRMRFDPYGFTINYHSNISDIFIDEYEWYTVNGGWLKCFKNDVVLYKSSGDYGVYDNQTAIECAKILFFNKNIHSFAGKEWDELNLNNLSL